MCSIFDRLLVLGDASDAGGEANVGLVVLVWSVQSV